MRNRFRMALALIATLPAAEGAMAHAAVVESRMVPGILIEAMYETGEPMSQAQVTVYGPADPARPALTGLTDESGVFGFVPTPGETGSWAVQVRQAGHGSMTHIRIGESSGPSTIQERSPASFNVLQRLIMAAAVIWGFIGTALFFNRRRRSHASS